MEAHTDRRDSLGQPAVHGTLEALREFQGARYGFRDERRVALGTGHAFLATRDGRNENQYIRPLAPQLVPRADEKERALSDRISNVVTMRSVDRQGIGFLRQYELRLYSPQLLCYVKYLTQ